MSKRLPYYQSEPAEYLTGDIMFCSYGAQGVFTIIRALYWQKECVMSLSQIKRRVKGADELIQELIDENIIKVNNGEVSINFLDEQYKLAMNKSKKNSNAGKKSAELKSIRKEINSKLAVISENSSETLEELQRKFNVNSTDVDFLLQQNSTIKIKKIKKEDEEEETDLVGTTEDLKQIDVIYDLFVKQVKNGEHAQWAESTYMQLGLKKGSLTALIQDFKNHLIRYAKIHPNISEFKKHLNSWLNQLDTLGKLNQYKRKAQGAL